VVDAPARFLFRVRWTGDKTSQLEKLAPILREISTVKLRCTFVAVETVVSCDLPRVRNVRASAASSAGRLAVGTKRGRQSRPRRGPPRRRAHACKQVRPYEVVHFDDGEEPAVHRRLLGGRRGVRSCPLARTATSTLR
jgi:hypothetical protein